MKHQIIFKMVTLVGFILILGNLSANSQIGVIRSQLSVSNEVAVGELEAVGRIPGCTATLVSWQTVLTAAHCVCPSDLNAIGCGLRRDFTLEQVFPVDNPSTPADESLSRTNITIPGTVHVHPEYTQAGWLRKDFAVITLDNPVYDVAQGINPIFVDNASVSAGDYLTLVGYGRTGGSCSEGSLGKRKLTLTVSEAVLDAIRFEHEGLHSCPGDSGGPVITDNGFVVGVASWTNSSDSSTYRPAYEVFDWIANLRDQVETKPDEYLEGTHVSSGASWDLDSYRSLYYYDVPSGKTPADIVGMGIAGSDDHIYTWYDVRLL